MKEKALYLVTLACYVGAVFLVTSDRFWAGIVCIGVSTCFMALARKRGGSSGLENGPEDGGK